MTAEPPADDSPVPALQVEPARWHRSVGTTAALLTVLTVLALLGGSCTPVTMAYPVRIHLGPTPEPLGLGRASTQMSFTTILPGEPWAPEVFSGGLRQHLGLTSWLELDADATLANVHTDHGGVMGSLGLRFFPVRHRIFKLGLSLGGGLGCGGIKATGSDGDEYRGGCQNGAPGRLAGGGYVGLQIASRLRWWFALYAGARYQLTGAREILLTHWLLYGVGLQFDFTRSRLVYMTYEAGFGHFRNRLDVSWGFYSTVSVGFRYGKASRR